MRNYCTFIIRPLLKLNFQVQFALGLSEELSVSHFGLDKQKRCTGVKNTEQLHCFIWGFTSEFLNRVANDQRAPHYHRDDSAGQDETELNKNEETITTVNRQLIVRMDFFTNQHVRRPQVVWPPVISGVGCRGWRVWRLLMFPQRCEISRLN